CTNSYGNYLFAYW
nr:immunoglobulin heavy chain junction region [Mus musculus]